MKFGFLFISILSVFPPVSLHATSSPEEIFSTIYENKLWGTNEQGLGWSGPGSSVKNTELYRSFIQDFLKKYAIGSVVDLGCGDWEFSRYINWNGIQYLGIDVVQSVITKNCLLFSKPNISFMPANALEFELPFADLLICKDVLQHLTNDDILKIAKQFKKYKYCLITNGVYSNTLSSDNPDIQRGDYRPVDLTQYPFNLQVEKVLTYYSQGFTMQVVLITNH